jgi:hypothetical protein
VLHDDGRYRHLRFANRNPRHAWAYWFDLITVPGALIFRGDGDSFVFAAAEDMFELFTESAAYGLNPSYWYQKLTGGREAAKSYSEERLNKKVTEELADAASFYPGVAEAWTAWFVDGDGVWYDTSYEIPARQALNDFRYQMAGTEKPFRFQDTDDWKLHDWDWWYLWTCHAIVWGIGQYDAARSTAKAEVAS